MSSHKLSPIMNCHSERSEESEEACLASTSRPFLPEIVSPLLGLPYFTPAPLRPHPHAPRTKRCRRHRQQRRPPRRHHHRRRALHLLPLADQPAQAHPLPAHRARRHHPHPRQSAPARRAHRPSPPRRPLVQLLQRQQLRLLEQLRRHQARGPHPLRLHRPRPHRLHKERPHLRRTRHRIHLGSRLRRPLRRQQPAAAHHPPDYPLRLLQAHHRRQARPRHRHDRHAQGPANRRLPRRQGRPPRHPRRPLPRIRHRQARGPPRRQRNRNPRRRSHRRRHRRLPHQRRQGRRRRMGHARPLVRALRHHPRRQSRDHRRLRPHRKSQLPNLLARPRLRPLRRQSPWRARLRSQNPSPQLHPGPGRLRDLPLSHPPHQRAVSPEALNLQSDAFEAEKQ